MLNLHSSWQHGVVKRSIVLTTLMFVLVSWTAVTIAQQKADRVHTTGQKDDRVHAVKPEPDLVIPSKTGNYPVTEFHYHRQILYGMPRANTQKGWGNRFLKFKGDYNLLCSCHLKTPDS